MDDCIPLVVQSPLLLSSNTTCETKVLEVTSVQIIENGGKLRGVASVRVGKVLIHGWRVVQQENQLPYVQPPQITWVENGKTRYGGPMIEFPPEKESAIKKEILLAWTEKTDGDNQ